MAKIRKQSTYKIDQEKIEKIAKENPDLPYEFIKGILISQQEAESGQCEEYHFGKK